MTDIDPARPLRPEPEGEILTEEEKRRRKKEKDQQKARSAWMSFAGRIVAQVVGAVATVILGLQVADRMRPAGGTGPVQRAVADPSLATQASIAVLPLTNLSGKPEDEYLADGLTEALITDLARIRSLKVISRTSVMQFKGQPKPIPEIARELGVAYVLEGSVAAGNGRMRVTAQLIDAATDVHLWTETYDRKASDVLSLQDDVSKRIAREVNVVLTPDEAVFFSRPSVDPETHALYLRGRYDLHKDGALHVAKAIETFEAVLERDPKHARALNSLAEAWILAASSVGGTTDPREAYPKAKEAALRAIELNAAIAGPHVALATVLYQHEREFAGAERELQKALSLNPGNVGARRTLALLLANMGRNPESIAEARKVLELDPLSRPLRQTLAVALYFGGQFAEAEKQAVLARGDEGDAGAFREFVAEIQLAAGKPQAALDEMKRIFGGEPQADGARALWAAAHAALGNPSVAKKTYAEFKAPRSGKYIPPRTLLILEVSLGLKDQAFVTIDRAIDEGSDIAHILKVHPLLAPLRTDARFARAVARAGLPPAQP